MEILCIVLGVIILITLACSGKRQDAADTPQENDYKKQFDRELSRTIASILHDTDFRQEVSLGVSHSDTPVDKKASNISFRARLEALVACDYLSENQSDRIRSNFDDMAEDRGGDEMVELDVPYFSVSDEFYKRHRDLLLCDRLEFNKKGESKYESHRFIPLVWPEDGMELYTLHVWREDSLFTLLDTAKITGVYVAGISFSRRDKHERASVSKLWIFYDVDKGGGDDEEDGPDGPTEAELPDEEPAVAEVLRILNPVSSTR